MKHRMTPDLARRLAVTVTLVVLYRLGAHIPLPGVPATDLTSGIGSLAMVDMFTGGALSQASLLSLGVMPYVMAQIIVQMIGYMRPDLGREWRMDETGQLAQLRLCRWLTMAIALVEGLGYAMLLAMRNVDLSAIPGGVAGAVSLVTFGLVVGESMVMLMGELIDQRGIGSGMSVMIFANVLATVPPSFLRSIDGGPKRVATTCLALLFVIAATFAITYVERGQRKIEIRTPRTSAANGRRLLGNTTYLPVKVNTAGMVPVIFASALLTAPSIIASLVPNVTWLRTFATAVTTPPFYWVLEVLLIVGTAGLYALTVVDPDRIADDLSQQGAFIPGVRPGKDTSTFIGGVVRRVTIPGALFMSCVAVIPQALYLVCDCELLSTLSGTSLLVIIGVAIDMASRVRSELDEASIRRES